MFRLFRISDRKSRQNDLSFVCARRGSATSSSDKDVETRGEANKIVSLQDINQAILSSSIQAKDQKSASKTDSYLLDLITLSQNVLVAGSKYGGNLNEEEKLALTQPVVRVFT
jgi:hypothetical protein